MMFFLHNIHPINTYNEKIYKNDILRLIVFETIAVNVGPITYTNWQTSEFISSVSTGYIF